MPEWIVNRLELSGEANVVAGAKSDLARPFEMLVTKNWTTGEQERATSAEVFSYRNIVSPFDEGISETEYFAKNTSQDPSDPAIPPGNWLPWNTQHWGVKWDASGVELVVDEPTELTYRFDSPTAPPVPVIERLSAKYPGLSIRLIWENERGKGAELEFSGGVTTKVTAHRRK